MRWLIGLVVAVAAAIGLLRKRLASKRHLRRDGIRMPAGDGPASLARPAPDGERPYATILHEDQPVAATAGDVERLFAPSRVSLNKSLKAAKRLHRICDEHFETGCTSSVAIFEAEDALAQVQSAGAVAKSVLDRICLDQAIGDRRWCDFVERFRATETDIGEALSELRYVRDNPQAF